MKCNGGLVRKQFAQAENQTALYPPREKTFRPSMLPAHAKSHIRFVPLNSHPSCNAEFYPRLMLDSRGLSRVGGRGYQCSSASKLFVFHCMRTVVSGCRTMYMQGGCLGEYNTNDGETTGEERCVADHGASVSNDCVNGEICMW
jgi:hypothetical protein